MMLIIIKDNNKINNVIIINLSRGNRDKYCGNNVIVFNNNKIVLFNTISSTSFPLIFPITQIQIISLPHVSSSPQPQ